MLSILVAMAIVLVVALAVVVYAAFPHRGAEVPAAPWLGDAMAKAVSAIPTLDHDESRDATDAPAGAGDRVTAGTTGRAERVDEPAGQHRVGFTR